MRQEVDMVEQSAEARRSVGSLLSLLAAVLLFVGVLLPVHSLHGTSVDKNSYVARGLWVALFVALCWGWYALASLGESKHSRWLLPLASCAALLAGIDGLTTRFQAVVTHGGVEGVHRVQASPGLGVYLVLASGLVGLLGCGLRYWGSPAGLLRWMQSAASRKGQ